MNEEYFISATSLDEITQKSISGDGEASWALFRYYTMVNIDYKMAYLCLVRAHEQGNPRATNKMMSFYREKVPGARG